MTRTYLKIPCFDFRRVRRGFDARHPWRAPLWGALTRVPFRSRRNCREHTFMNDKTSEAGLLYCVHAAERVQRVLLHPGLQVPRTLGFFYGVDRCAGRTLPFLR